MTRKASKKEEPSNAKDVQWGGYVDIRLTDAQKAAFSIWHEDNASQVWLDFAESVASGLKFGLSYNPDGDFWVATFTASGHDVIGLHDRYCLTARAPKWEVAVSLLCYKHRELARGDWGSYSPRTMQMENFG